MSATSIWRQFYAAFPEVGGHIPINVLTTSLSRSLFSHLQPSRIPTHPLDRADVVTISEAMDALYIYARLVIRILDASKDHERTLLNAFPDVWQWILFVSPERGNVALDDYWMQELPDSSACWLRTDGFVAMPTAFLLRCLSLTIVGLSLHARGVHVMVAQPDFSDTVFSLLTRDTRPTKDTARIYHGYTLAVVNLIRSHVPAVAKRLRADVAAYDARHPGRLICAIAHRFAWFFDPQLTSEAPEEQTFVDRTSLFFDPEFMTDDATVANLQAARPVPGLVRLLASVTSRPGWEECPPFHLYIVGLWLGLIASITVIRATPSLSNAIVISSLRSGFLPVLYQVLSRLNPLFAANIEARNHMIDCRREADSLTENLVKAIVWPRVLRAFGLAFQRDQCAMPTKDDPVEWRLLLQRWSYYQQVRTGFKETMAVKLEYCFNPECRAPAGPNGETMKVCACAVVIYCSKTCQRRHWRAAHRETCQSRLLDITPNMPLPPGAKWTSADNKSATEMEISFFARCAREVLMDFGEPARLRDVRTVVIDLISTGKPFRAEEPSGVRAPRMTNGGHPARIQPPPSISPYPTISYGDYDNTPILDPDSTSEKPYLHIFVRASRGSYTTIVNVDSAPHEDWMSIAGFRGVGK
ncbi:hypothetical protein BD626DRAFT_514129 [Schizophyllum amplum]|uniref:MYND-type domain-containing protein n=1 Tax=Schizophyllum amplum TaxID=97359 RepID=A0A550BYM5_9AGAR|nr:hypothetical protein BD626DRAFT_514129 [Auriculariopsis ampla]